MEESEKMINKPRKWLKYLLYLIWACLIIGFVSLFLFLSSISKGDLPSFEELENPKYDLASVVYDTNGEPFGKYFIENREQISFDQLSPHIYNALLTTEDLRYYDHTGIDFRALLRVAFKTVLFRKESSGGGSTISQQLAKLLFRRPNLSGKSALAKIKALVEVKVKEWFTAIKLEKQYTKDEIMAMYLNKFDFINGAHGIEAASQTYFGKSQEFLAPEEAATLVGMLKNPSLYNPLRFPKKSENRRNVVLGQLKKYGHIDQVSFDSLSSKSLNMDDFERDAHDKGPAPHFRSELTKWLKALFKEKEYLKPDGTEYNIYTDGLQINTTIDLAFQQHAEEAVFDHMKANQAKYWKVWDNKNPWTHEADETQKELRLSVLERRLKESDRYLALHNAYLGAIKAKIRTQHANLPLSENVIKALIKVKDQKQRLSHYFKNNTLKEKYVNEYKDLVTHKDMDELRDQFNQLKEAYVTVFDTPVSMKIFDYEKGEIEVEMSPRDSVKYHNQHLQSGLLSVDPKTGHIKAWVGGVGFKYFKFDHVNSKRQVGSTIKPFVYATAISLQGISPCQEFEDIQYTIAPGDVDLFVDEEWSPANANEKFTGNLYNLYQGLLYSKNSITVRLVKELGSVDVIREVLHNCGIDKKMTLPSGRLAVPRLPSMVLGAADLSVRDMAGAYTAFANNGNYTEPIFVSTIRDKSGKIIYSGVPERSKAINPLYNAVMVDMLMNNLAGGYNLGLKSKAGGKTGTTNDFADAWFMGITPNLVTGIWVGGDDNWIRFLTLDNGQGFVMARPIFQNYMKKIEADEAIQFDVDASFVQPPDGFQEITDCARYKQQTPDSELQETTETQSNYDEFDDEFEEEEFDEEFEEEFDEEF